MCKHVRSLNPLCVPYCTALLPYYSNCLRKFSKTGVWQYAVISSGVLNVTDLAPKKNHVLHTPVWCLPYLYTAVRPSVQGTRIRETYLICVLRFAVTSPVWAAPWTKSTPLKPRRLS